MYVYCYVYGHIDIVVKFHQNKLKHMWVECGIGFIKRDNMALLPREVPFSERYCTESLMVL